MRESESIKWDEERKEIVVTKQKRIDMKDVSGIEEAKIMLRTELKAIIREVKSLKRRAEEIKALLNEVQGQVEPIGP